MKRTIKMSSGSTATYITEQLDFITTAELSNFSKKSDAINFNGTYIKEELRDLIKVEDTTLESDNFATFSEDSVKVEEIDIKDETVIQLSDGILQREQPIADESPSFSLNINEQLGCVSVNPISTSNLNLHKNAATTEKTAKKASDCRVKLRKLQLITCEYCLKHYASKQRLAEHIFNVHFPITELMSFPKDWQLLRHINIHKSDNPLFCALCSETFSDKLCLVTHMRSHNGDIHNVGNISLSSKKSSIRKGIRPHKKKKTKKLHTCEICSKNFSRSQVLKIHKRIHTNEKPYSCPNCSKSFYREDNMKVHMRIHTGEKPHSCRICAKAFSRIDVLANHIKIHTGERDYTCDICSKPFARKDALVCHMNMIHLQPRFKGKKSAYKIYCTAKKNYSCTFCSKKFTVSCRLNEHLRTHTGDRPFSCSKCSRKFYRRYELKIHVKSHTHGERPYTCDICSKSFVQRATLVRHIKDHTG